MLLFSHVRPLDGVGGSAHAMIVSLGLVMTMADAERQGGWEGYGARPSLSELGVGSSAEPLCSIVSLFCSGNC